MQKNKNKPNKPIDDETKKTSSTSIKKKFFALFGTPSNAKKKVSALSEAPSKKQLIISYALTGFFLALLIVVFILTRTYLQAWPISGSSMEPTVHNGDKVILIKTDNLEYGDVVVFHTDETSVYKGKSLIKRIIGKPGDTISVRYDAETNSCHVYRNGQVLDESYINESMRATYGARDVVVPEGFYYVLGDNRNHSTDSHLDVYAAADSIEGKVLLRYTSISDIEIVERHAS